MDILKVLRQHNIEDVPGLDQDFRDLLPPVITTAVIAYTAEKNDRKIVRTDHLEFQPPSTVMTRDSQKAKIFIRTGSTLLEVRRLEKGDALGRPEVDSWPQYLLMLQLAGKAGIASCVILATENIF